MTENFRSLSETAIDIDCRSLEEKKEKVTSRSGVGTVFGDGVHLIL